MVQFSKSQGQPPPPPGPPPGHQVTPMTNPEAQTNPPQPSAPKLPSPVSMPIEETPPIATVVQTDCGTNGVHNTPPLSAAPTNTPAYRFTNVALPTPMTNETHGTSVYVPLTATQQHLHHQTPTDPMNSQPPPMTTPFPTPSYHQPTPTYYPSSIYAPPPQVTQTMMTQQLQQFQQLMMQQNKIQIELLQQQVQQSIETSLKAITETVSKTLAAIPQPVQQQNKYLPFINCGSPVNSDKADMSDYKSTASAMLHHTNPNSSPSHVQETEQASTTSSKNEMLEFVNALKEQKLTFTPLKQNTDFLVWQSMMALKCSKSSKYAHLTEQLSSGGYIFKTNLDANDSSTLFMLIYDSLTSISNKIIVDVTNPNGIELLQQIEDHYIDIDTSIVNRQLLQQEFDNFKRKENESYIQFANQFARKLKELELNKVTIPTDEATVAYKYLQGLNEPRINIEICLELATKTDWYLNMTLTEIAKKAQRYMKQYTQLLKMSTAKSSNNTNSKKQEVEKPKMDTSQKQNQSQPKEDTPKQSHEDRVKIMESYLAKANNVEAYLQGIKKNDKEIFLQSYKERLYKLRNL